MRKILKVLSSLAFIGGILEIVLSMVITGGTDLICIGIIIGIIGFLGCLCTYQKSSEFVFDMF